MYVAIRCDVLRSGGYPNLVEGLEAVGLDSLEVSVGRDRAVRRLVPKGDQEKLVLDSAGAVKEWGGEYERYGVKMCAFLLANDFNAPDMGTMMEWVVWASRLAAEVGVTAIRIDSAMTGQHDLPLEQRIALFVRRARELVEATEGTGVSFGVENHGRQGNDPVWMQAVIDGVGSPRFGYTMDTGNFYWAGHPLSRVYEILEQFAPWARHTHVKNINYPPETREVQRELGWQYGKYVSPIYEGDIDHRRVAEILQRAGYQGSLCIEDESLGHFEEAERRVVLKKDAQYLKSLV